MKAQRQETTVESDVSCWLGTQVQADFIKARDARVKTDALLLQCLRQRKGEYDAEELAGLKSIKTFVNATNTKCRACEAWLDDVLASTRERPWTISRTPIPSVPQFVRDMIIEKIKKEIIEMGGAPLEVEAYIRDRAQELKQISVAKLEAQADAAAERMTVKIQDQLLDADFEQAFTEFRSDLTTYPYAVLKGPVVRNKKVLKWVGTSKSPQVQTEAVMRVERVSPFDFYWAPWATCPNEGYTVEIMRMEQRALYDCIELPHFDGDKIRLALDQYEQGYQANAQVRTQREALEQNTNLIDKGDTIDVLDYWGCVKGSLLIEWGVSNIDDADGVYEVNVWVVDNICIRAVLNPDPLGERPYYISSYEKIPGAIVGRSVPMLMRPHQEVINSSYRALRRNMGLASGPFAEVDQQRLEDGQAPEEILPGMVKLVTTDLTGSNQPAYKFHQINSHAAELLGVIAAETKACDDATGIPAYSYGNAAASGAGRTVGGLAMLMGNASKGMKKVIGHIERDVLEKLIRSYYNYNMLYDPDESLKVDAQVSARGPTGIIMREALIQRRLEALQLITPYVNSGVVQKEGLAVLLREVLTGLDMPVDKIIPDPERAKVLQDAVQATVPQQAEPQISFNPEQLDGSTAQPTGQGQGQVQMQPGAVGQGTTPMAVPDGRSPGAMQVVQSQAQF
jgi:hypothetical protein